MNECAHLLSEAGITPTPNRILVVKALSASASPLSLMDIEEEIGTLDKSSVSRVLALLSANRMVHALEDGRGIVRYELCRTNGGSGDSDLHVHFYCEECRKVFCMEGTPVPVIQVPDAYKVTGVNCMLKGICPACGGK